MDATISLNGSLSKAAFRLARKLGISLEELYAKAIEEYVKLRAEESSPADAAAPQRQPRFRARENAWRQKHRDVLREYAGEWLVLEGEEIIAHGEDPAPLVDQARELGIESPYVFYVEPVRKSGVVKMGL